MSEDPKVCDKNCHNCVYYHSWHDVNKHCNYYLMTDKRRPCDPGEGCTVKVTRKREREKGNG